MTIPICSNDEMKEVTNRISTLLSQIDVMAAEIDSSLAKISSLRQSILKKAFAGRLVLQDPSDEPAETLLARLRAEANDANPSAKVRRKQFA
jgi:type I restriction enzyme, S subunit